MKKRQLNKGLINEVNDMRHMMRNLEKNRHSKQQLNEQPFGMACELNNGGCHPDCVCIELGNGYGNAGSGFEGVDCCCGNDLITIDGCQPGPCMNHSDCGIGYDCCYADSGMMSMGLTSCNLPDDCYDYAPGVSSNPNSTTETACLDTQALNYDTNSNSNWISNEQCCYSHNSGCKHPAFGGDATNDCDCNNEWAVAGFGNIDCCVIELGTDGNPTGTGTGNSSNGTGTYVTIGSLGWGSSCFIDGSMVLMSNGEEKNISAVKVGEEVKSENGNSQVTSIDVHTGEFEIYSFNGGRFFTTAEHPFKTVEGWKALNPVDASKKHGVNTNILKKGDTLIRLNEQEELKEITKDEEKHSTVYNLKLDNEHVYYVDGYLVHNAKDGAAGTGVVKDKGKKPNPVDLTDDGSGTGTGEVIPVYDKKKWKFKKGIKSDKNHKDK